LLSTQLQQLFNDYHQAFRDQNITKVLACYHLPCTLVTPDRLVLLTNISEASAEFEQIFSGLNSLAIHSFKALSASYGKITDNIIAANVHWQFVDQSNTIIADFCALYHIVKCEQQLKIVQVISHENEQAIALPFSLNLSETV